MSRTPTALWDRVVESKQDHERSMRAFLADTAHRAEALRSALRGPQRDLALNAVWALSEDEKKRLLPEWVHLARCAHGPFQVAWNVLLSLPRDWAVDRVRPEMDAILAADEEDDYWMFLQLADQLDAGLARVLAERAARHEDPDIRALGEDFLNRHAG